MGKTRAIAVLAAVAALGGCGTSEEAAEPAERETSPDCSVFESVHATYWAAYQSLPDSVTYDSILSDEPVVSITKPQDRETQGGKAAHDSVVRAWPLVTDETLRYLMKEMAEAPTRGDWQRNFTSASSYCDLPDQPIASK